MKTRTIIIGMGIGSNSGREILSGVFSYIEQGHSWHPKLVQSAMELTPEALRKMEDGGVDGYLLSFCGNDATCEFLKKSAKPLVFIGTRRDGFFDRAAPTAFVWNDNAAIGATGARHLLSLGVSSSYAFVHAAGDPAYSAARLHGFTEALRGAGRRTMPSFDSRAATGTGPYIDELSAWLEGLPKPAAVMAANDSTALCVLDAAARSRIKVPEQLMVVGVDNDALLVSHSSPPLTSVHPGHFEMGMKAAAELERLMLSHHRTSARIFNIPPHGVAARESTRSAPPAVVLVERAHGYMRQKASTGITAADIVAHLGCSRELADLRFREIEGRTLHAALEAFRMDEVKRLLKTTRRPLDAVARQCGLKSAAHLCHVFRRHTGVSPRVWSRNGRNA